MNKINFKNSQKGSTLLWLIIGVILLIIVVGYMGIKPGGFLSKYVMQNIPSTSSSVPYEQWLTYDGTNPKFSVKYPSDWGYQIREGGESGNLIVLQFMPKGGSTEAKVNNVAVRVLDRKNATTLQDWVNKYTTRFTPDDPAAQDRGYTLYKVKDISNAKVGEKDIVSFSTDTVAAGQADGTIIASDKYVFIFIGLSGKAEDVRSKMISSLSV